MGDHEKIEVKDVTGVYNPNTFKASDDRFNPGNRIYVRAQLGQWQRLRKGMGWFFMLFFLALPWLRYDGRQAILFDIGNQQFHIFAATIWPQDLTLLAWIFMIAAFGLFFLTTFLGRVWCGYLCPQTVWTFLFIWFEEKLEGPANKRRKLDAAPWGREKIVRKGSKHLAWMVISLITGLTFVGYFQDMMTLVPGQVTLSIDFWPLFWVLFFAACTYGNAGFMRAIMCVHMCPYARFQSAMFDKDTFIVGYDARRGEQRGARSRKADPKAMGLGDCIDCDLCVQVCPTGIDIRDGLQYECINCGACVDACDQTMDRMGYAKGLISYTTEHKLAGNDTQVARPKLIGYGLVMAAMLSVFAYNAMSIMPMGLDVLRDRNQLFRENSDGLIENTYNLKILNKTLQPQVYRLAVEGLPDYQWYGPREVTLKSGEILNQPVSLGVNPDNLRQGSLDIRFVLIRKGAGSDPKGVIKQESKFISRL
ncbi:cytochrome c oxidase accessory protein CcoG [Aeromonas schubertii]|uniref:cytochrome c oxidase accessory protein CcoG n=1 Tax=Aeromonas schubertii TaxID=652 RepID=UPI0010A7A5EC|nr:cytochrome c oxidase accessory protein CcoG [Aeromonas schubertii]QCG46662.1 cytochrome c oxidase accessory protein CcoG [Aeromonas schubertii]